MKFTRDLADCDQLRRARQRRAAVDLAVGRRRHRLLHDDRRDREHAVRRLHRAAVRGDVHRDGGATTPTATARSTRTRARLPRRWPAGRPRRSSSISTSTSGRPAWADRTSRRSAIPRTSTTASARLACASCRGGRFASEQAIARRDCVRIMRRQAAGRSSHLPALPSGGGRGARGAEDAVACQPADGARRGGGPRHRDNRARRACGWAAADRIRR